MSSSVCSARLARIRDSVCELGVYAMYVRDTANIQWATAFEGVFDEERAHALFIPVEGEPALHTDSRYITAMQREAEDSPIEVDAEQVTMSNWVASKVGATSLSWDAVETAPYGARGEGPVGTALHALSAGRTKARPLQTVMQAPPDVGTALHALSSERGTVARLAIEDTISLHEYRDLEKSFNGAPFVETHDLIVGLRAVKDADEIERLKSAQAVTDAALSHICGFIKPGMTERQVQLELDDFMMCNGASGLAFPTIIASGTNGASPHAIVSDKPLEAGECIVMDFGARRAGYCSDMTRTVFLGQPEGKMLEAWEALREANEHVEAMLRPGITGKEAHEAALAVLEKQGFGGLMGHGLGHGVGIEIHELPVLSPRNSQPLVPGNVVTVEPGIYIPGEFGMRLEDFGVVTEAGFDVFTKSTHGMIVL